MRIFAIIILFLYVFSGLVSYHAGALGLDKIFIGDVSYAQDLPQDYFRGAIPQGDDMIVATRGEVVIITQDENIFKRLDHFKKQIGDIKRIGQGWSERIALETATGFYSCSPDMGFCEPSEERVHWSSESDVSPTMRNVVIAMLQQDETTLADIFTALHTGRIMGPFGPYILGLLLLLSLGVLVPRRSSEKLA